MNKLVFIGVDARAKGGVAAVLSEYKKIFNDAIFIESTKASGFLLNFYCFILALIKVFWITCFYRDVIFHIHGSSYKSFDRKYILYFMIKALGHKSIYHIHGGEFDVFYNQAHIRKKRRIKSMIEGVDCLVCLSEGWSRYFSNNFNLQKIEVVKNVVPDCGGKLVNKNYKNEAIFLYLGHINESKGIWLLMQAAVVLKRLNKKFKILVGGHGDVNKLLKFIDVNNLSDRVTFLGWVSGDQKERLFGSASVFILPSFVEGMPVSILEAMAHQLPIIATNVGGIPDIISPDCGILMEPGDVDSLVKAMSFSIENPHEIEKMGICGGRKVIDHYPESVKSKLLSIYSSL